MPILIVALALPFLRLPATAPLPSQDAGRTAQSPVTDAPALGQDPQTPPRDHLVAEVPAADASDPTVTPPSTSTLPPATLGPTAGATGNDATSNDATLPPVPADETQAVSADPTATTPDPTATTAPRTTPAPTATPSTDPFVATATTVTCTSTVASGGNIQYALDHMANGGTLCLSGSYNLGSRAVIISNRSGITIDGRGASLTSSGCSPQNGLIYIQNSTGITVRNATLSGTNADGGTANAYHRGCEDQGGVMVYGGSSINVYNVTVQRTYGECFYVDRGGSPVGTGPWASYVTFRDSTCRWNGRQAVAITGGSHITIKRVTFTKVAISILDIEPYTSTAGGTYVSLTDNIINGYGQAPSYTAWILETDAMNGYTSTVVHDVTVARNTINSGVRISSNTVTSAGLAVKVREEYRQNISVYDNVSYVPGYGPALYFEWVNGVHVYGNTQKITSGSLCWSRSSSNVSCTA